MSFIGLGVGLILCILCVRLGYCVSVYSEAYRLLRECIACFFITDRLTYLHYTRHLLYPNRLLPSFFSFFIKFRFLSAKDLIRQGSFSDAFSTFM